MSSSSVRRSAIRLGRGFHAGKRRRPRVHFTKQRRQSLAPRRFGTHAKFGQDRQPNQTKANASHAVSPIAAGLRPRTPARGGPPRQRPRDFPPVYHSEEANRYLRKSYRQPYAVSEAV